MASVGPSSSSQRTGRAPAGESAVAKCPDQRGQFLGREMRSVLHRKRPQVDQRAIQSALATRLRQRPERLLGRVEVQIFPGVEPDEFIGPDDLQLY